MGTAYIVQGMIMNWKCMPLGYLINIDWLYPRTTKLFGWVCVCVFILSICQSLASILVWHNCASTLSGWVLYRQLELTKLTCPDLHHVVGLFILNDIRPTCVCSVRLCKAQIIASMDGCVVCNDLWPWPISSSSFSHDFAIKLLKCNPFCRVPSTAC